MIRKDVMNRLREEGEKFHFRLGKFHFLLRKYIDWTDRVTGKVHYKYEFKIQDRSLSEWVDWFVFYPGWYHPDFRYQTASYFDGRHRLTMSLGWGDLYWYFPWRSKKYDDNACNDDAPEYGFYLYGHENKFFNEIVFEFGKFHKRIYMPWELNFYRHSVLLKDGSWWGYTDKQRKKTCKKEKVSWDDSRFFIEDNDERILTKEFPFRYTTRYGEVQDTTARCYIEEREWRPRCLSWTKLFAYVKPVVNISFKDEMGSERGSWKGGVVGVSAPMTKEEKKNRDIESALRRYEERVNKIHDYDR